MFLSSFLVAIFAIMQYLNFDPFGKIAVYKCSNKVSACLDNPNLVGNYLVLSLPLFFLFKDKKFWVGMGLVILGILASKSHFAIFLMGFSILSYLFIRFRHSKSIIISLLGVVVASIFLIFHFDFAKLNLNISGRLDVWKVAVTQFKASPLLGQGIGVWKSIMVRTYNGPVYTDWTTAHNDWLERLVELGVVGVFLLVLVIVNSLRCFNWKENTPFMVCFLTFLVMCFGSFPLETSTVFCVGWMSFCAVEKL